MHTLIHVRKALVAMFTGEDTDHESGASLVEYVLLILGIALVVVVVVRSLGGTIRDLFDQTQDELEKDPIQSGGTPAPGP